MLNLAIDLRPLKLSPTMSLQADVFDPDVVRGTLKGLYKSAAEKSKFERDWKADVRISFIS